LYTDPHINISPTFCSVVCFPLPPGPQKPLPEPPDVQVLLLSRPTGLPKPHGTSLRDRPRPPKTRGTSSKSTYPGRLGSNLPILFPKPRTCLSLASGPSKDIGSPTETFGFYTLELTAYAPPNVSQTRPKIVPRCSQHGLKMDQNGTPRRPGWPQEDQVDFLMVQDSPKMAIMTPRWRKMTPRWPTMLPK
jgi:hypothetical protein